MSENFGEYPVSVTEVRALRNTKPESWGARDVLIHLLRQIDSGELSMDHVVVSFAQCQRSGGIRSSYVQAGRLDPLAQVGLLHQVATMMSLSTEETDEDED